MNIQHIAAIREAIAKVEAEGCVCAWENLTPELGVQDLALFTEECEAEGAR